MQAFAFIGGWDIPNLAYREVRVSIDMVYSRKPMLQTSSIHAGVLVQKKVGKQV